MEPHENDLTSSQLPSQDRQAPQEEPTAEPTAQAAEPVEAQAAQEPQVLPPQGAPKGAPKREQVIPLRFALLLTCVLVATSILLTYTLTSLSERRQYTQRLLEQQAVIDSLKGDGTPSSRNMALLDAFLDYYALYADTMDRSEMLNAAFRAYVEASGDKYAQYYSREEYLALLAESNGSYCGIGVSVVTDTLSRDGQDYRVFRVSELYEEAPALAAGMELGDLIWAVKVEGTWRTVNDLGEDAAKAAIRGEEGTTVAIKVFRASSGVYVEHELAVLRRQVEKKSVLGSLYEGDARIGILRITEFNRNTPRQFKEQIKALRDAGAQSFIFDVRDNPGGDLQSIKAVLSYFLQPGDLILEARDKSGAAADRHVVEASSFTGDYADCSVAASEIGMYADLEMVILCNKKTASAAEVFTATLRDYREERGLRLRAIVGDTTFGKGIMQTTREILLEDTVGYVKLTTHTYVTHCGVSYHGFGIEPTDRVPLSQEAESYDITKLPQSMDAQLQTAALKFQFQ